MEKFGSGIRDGKNSDSGSGIKIPDPQHCSAQSEHRTKAYWHPSEQGTKQEMDVTVHIVIETRETEYAVYGTVNDMSL
jgi:hypothetical protein